MSWRWAIASLGLLASALAATSLRPVARPSTPSHAEVPALTGRVYAQRVVELHLKSPDGKVVGRAHPGAVVVVQPVDARHVRVALPEPGREKGTLWLLAERSGFTRSFVRAVPPEFPPESRLVRAVVATELFPEEESQDSFAVTICGEVHVLQAARGHGDFVSQVHENVELMGWTSAPVLSLAWSCNTRRIARANGRLLLRGGATTLDEEEVTSIPPSFVTWSFERSDGGPDAFQKKVTAGTTYFLLSPEPGTRAGKCYEWKFVPRGAETVLVRRLPLIEDGKRVHASYGVGYDRGVLSLTGPHYHAQPLDRDARAPSVGGYRCARRQEVAGVTDDLVRFAYAGHDDLAWHPDDEEHWYAKAADCEAARQKYDAALAADRDARPPGGPHVDECFGAFGEKDDR